MLEEPIDWGFIETSQKREVLQREGILPSLAQSHQVADLKLEQSPLRHILVLR